MFKKVTVKSTLCLTKYRTLKTYGGADAQLHAVKSRHQMEVSSRNLRTVTSRRLWWLGHVARTGYKKCIRNFYRETSWKAVTWKTDNA